MNDFFISIEGLSSENLTTEILAQILLSPDYEAYQRLFYSHLFQSSELKSTDELGLEVSTQRDFKGFGRPDMIISNDDSVFLFENKFYAPYSKENQISRYVQILNEYYPSYSRKEIFLLTIRSRVEHYKAKIKYDLEVNNVNCDSLSIKFLLWDDLLKIFASDNFVINNLIFFIKNRFIVSTELSQEDLVMLSNNKFPQALNKVFNLVPIVRDLLSSSYSVERMSQSYNYYGFTIRQDSFKAWFGYFFPLWLNPPIDDICTPFYIQIREDWIKEGIDLYSLNQQLINLGFIKHKDFHWVKPYELELLSAEDYSSDELITENLGQAIRNDLEKIRNITISFLSTTMQVQQRNHNL